MAKRSKIVANERRREIVARHAARRAELKETLRHPGTSPEDRRRAQLERQRQPRDASATRIRNRDAVDGRPRGHLRASGSPASGSGNWPTRATCPASRSPVGSRSPEESPMKVRASLRSLKDKPGSKVVRRHGKIFVINKLNPRWKGRQG